MKVVKKTIAVLTVFVCMITGIAMASSAETPSEEPTQEKSSRLNDIVLDVSMLYGTWECPYHSEGGYVRDGTLQISFGKPAEKRSEGSFRNEIVTVTHNLNDIWAGLSELMEINFASGDFRILAVETEGTYVYEIEIPVSGFLKDQRALVRISEKGLSYQDPDMRETNLSRVDEPEQSDNSPAESGNLHQRMMDLGHRA